MRHIFIQIIFIAQILSGLFSTTAFAQADTLKEVVISGTMKEVSKLNSPVPVEVYSAKFFKANPTPSLFDALQNVNGVRPQLNCNVCNTGDIHINGLEGPYTMILIDGMPIVSGLSSVYGLTGIPQSLIERIEVVKGPASTLYGSEAVGGLINVITKNPSRAPAFSAEMMGSTWTDLNLDLAGKIKIGNRTRSLLSFNYFNYSNPLDKNRDGFTDVTLQNRISVFNKWQFDRPEHKKFSLAARYIYEDRWGGEMNWNATHRGGDSIYGESIYTKRWELFGTYQLPFREKILFQWSANHHDQNSAYGKTLFPAKQFIGLAQLVWHKTYRAHDFTLGHAYRYTFYDDNTPATAAAAPSIQNQPVQNHLPGIFVQDEITLSNQNTLLLGLRYDQHSVHGKIWTPRLNYKWNTKDALHVLRLSLGNGYRVVNVFTEDHAALTGARQVEFLSNLKPETSWNANLNMVKKIYTEHGVFITLDATAFYTFFNNKIVADYDSNPNKIIYDNLHGHAVSKGLSLQIDMSWQHGLNAWLGATFMDVYQVENNQKSQQMFTEKFSGVWNIGYRHKKSGWSADYTGNVYSPMRLPLLSTSDPRRPFSPWWSIQNFQITKSFKSNMEMFIGIKNLLNWTPAKGNPFLIARSNDPFDKNVEFDAQGQAIKTDNNPYGLTFDTSYVYGPIKDGDFF